MRNHSVRVDDRGPQKAPKFPHGDGEPVPGPDICRRLTLRRETLRIFVAGVGPDEVRT